MNTLEKLEKRVSSLGNHYQKYLFTIYKFKDSLIQALETSGKLMQVHLWSSSSSHSEEMSIISNLSENAQVQVQHLSCYYALQFLHMNFRNLDILALGVASNEILPDVYNQFMMNIGSDFRELTSAYIENLLDIYLPKEKRPEFFICSVGTRADQDDIDIGIITSDNSDVEELNQAFRKITQNMLVYATPLHLYLSEHVGKQLYTSSISEYIDLLGKRIQNVVIISELINAKRMFGSEALLKKFQEKVISKYFYNSKKNIRFHEGFLRGILGEVRALNVSPLRTDAISPKDDSLRMLKLILYAKKSICNIEEVNAWDIINVLAKKETQFHSHYEFLFKAASFLEMFKFLLHMFVVQEETFRLDEIDQKQLDFIAEKMGYGPIGTVGAWDQLIIDYYRYVKEVRNICDFLLEDISKHLSSVSTFLHMLKSDVMRDAKGRYKGNVAKDFIKGARFFLSTKYWEDILKSLKDDPKLLDSFIQGFEELYEDQQNKLIQEYVEWAQYSPITLIRLITIIGEKQKNVIDDTVHQRINLAFLRFIENIPDITERLCHIFSYYPKYLHEYLQYLPEVHYEYLNRILDRLVIEDEIKDYQIQFKELYNIHKWSSHYFHRFFYRVVSNHPEYLRFLTDSSRLNKISSGLLAKVDLHLQHPLKKQILGDYYDLEFLRIGIGTMHGVDLYITNREFTEFCDNYMRKLFDICTNELEKERASILPNTETFAVLAAGGHARGQAYDDDYDLIALVDTDDKEVIQHATRVITRMNREVLKRGLLPHYRLGEILGGFVNPISQIIKYLESDTEESFIDLSQLLGARMIIGSDIMESVINEKILNRFIFNKKSLYIKRMIKEIHNRQNVIGKCDTDVCNIKETRGGLRDIEAVTLMLKAYSGITYPLSPSFLEEMKIYFYEISKELDILLQAIYFLRTVRNLHRITEAAEDNIHPDYLSKLAQIFHQNNRPEWGKPELLFNTIKHTLNQSADACEKIISFLQTHNS